MPYTHTDTNLTIENEYPKLVRDNIPAMIKRERGIDVKTTIITDDEIYLKALLKKILEEATELSYVETDGHLQEEIADVYEVLDAILKLKQWPKEVIATIQKDKRTDRGGFDRRILMMEKPKNG